MLQHYPHDKGDLAFACPHLLPFPIPQFFLFWCAVRSCTIVSRETFFRTTRPTTAHTLGEQNQNIHTQSHTNATICPSHGPECPFAGGGQHPIQYISQCDMAPKAARVRPIADRTVGLVPLGTPLGRCWARQHESRPHSFSHR